MCMFRVSSFFKQQNNSWIITTIIIVIIIIIIIALISDPTRIHTHCTLQHSPTFYQLNGEQRDHRKFPNNNYVHTFIYYDPTEDIDHQIRHKNAS